VGKGIVVAAVMAMLLAFAGCGGGSDPTISEAEYKTELKLVCNESEQRVQDLVTQLKKEYEARSQKAEAQYQAENIQKLMVVYEETTEELSDIGLPEGNEEEAETLVHEREEAAAKVQASPLGTRDAFPVIFKGANEILKKHEAPGCVL
jgi:apolipoprotein N-acyltransferase